jgi:hypothetical protein
MAPVRSLDRAQELALRAAADMRDLLDEERTVVRARELIVDARRLVLFVGIDANEVVVLARADLVEQPRHALAPGAALAFDEQRRILVRRLLHPVAKLAHRGRAAEQLIAKNEWSHERDVLRDFAL